jgi:V/A-type H+/Na+-transporting ATPase subunit E
MGLEVVKEEIIRNAKTQEQALLAEAKKEADNIVKETQDKIAGFKEKVNAEAKKFTEIISRQEAASAELEGKKMLLEAKKEVVDIVFDETRKRLNKLSDKKREAYLKKLLAKAKKDIDVAKIFCNKNDTKIIKDPDAEPMDMIGGLIAENRDGTVRVDYCFDTLLQNIKENELQKISKILFE